MAHNLDHVFFAEMAEIEILSHFEISPYPPYIYLLLMDEVPKYSQMKSDIIYWTKGRIMLEPRANFMSMLKSSTLYFIYQSSLFDQHENTYQYGFLMKSGIMIL